MNQMEFYQAKLAFETDSWDLFQGLEAGEGLAVVDARSKAAWQAEHIPGAVNIPHAAMSDLTCGHLDRSLTYVTYCDGIGCNASTKGALNLTKLGFKVKELLGGLDWWKRDGYATDGERSVSGKRVAKKEG